MIILQFLPTSKSRNWRNSSLRMRSQGLQNMRESAPQIAIEQSWFGWRISDEDTGTVLVDDTSQAFRTELTEAGEQTVIPGCERDDARTGTRQMDLF